LGSWQAPQASIRPVGLIATHMPNSGSSARLASPVMYSATGPGGFTAITTATSSATENHRGLSTRAM
jgi:hypothetical protein